MNEVVGKACKNQEKLANTIKITLIVPYHLGQLDSKLLFFFEKITHSLFLAEGKLHIYVNYIYFLFKKG